MKDSLKNIIVLTLIAVIAAFALSYVNDMTKEQIKENRFREVKKALDVLMPEHDNDVIADAKDVDGVQYFIAKKGGQDVAYAFESSSDQGYSGEVRAMICCDPEGVILGVAVVKHQETFPAINDPKLHGELIGKGIKNAVLAVKKDGGDVQHVSGATLSSRALTYAARDGLVKFHENILGEEIDMAALLPQPKEEVPGPSVPVTAEHLAVILPAYDNDPLNDFKEIGGVKYYIARQGGAVTGYGVYGSSEEGFGGKVEVMAGIDINMTVQGVVILAHEETTGYGKEALESKDYWTRFKGLGLDANWAVQADGGDFEHIKGSVSSATMSSRASVGAVKAALDSFVENREELEAAN